MNHFMIWKIISTTFTIVVILFLSFYWLFPFNTVEFYTDFNSNSNFSLNSFDSDNMQFYDSMRFQAKEISYRIDKCPLYKENNIEQAFDIISNLTSLIFYPVSYDEEIYATCEERIKPKGTLFVVGEGGPINITKTQNFNVIFKGEITLVKESGCKTPNIALHEILHVLGFDHSLNKNNIMYNVTKCNQVIGEDIINKINELYSFPTYFDLAFENVTAIMHGKYLDTNVSIRNHGLKDSENATLKIYADEKLIKEFILDSIKVGYGTTLSLKNILILKINVNELSYLIESNFQELNKNNNKIKLEIKNN